MVVFEDLFKKSMNNCIYYNNKKLVLHHLIRINDKAIIELKFIEVNSNWRQGVILNTDGSFILNDEIKLNDKIILWENKLPNILNIEISSNSSSVVVYNVWDTGNGTTEAWHNGAAMYINKQRNQWTYYCNDGYPDDDLNDLIFNIKLIN